VIHKRINFIWQEELPEQLKESIILPNYKDDKTDCCNYRDISLLLTTYITLANNLLARLIPYAEEIFGGHQCGYPSKRSTTNHIFCIRQKLEKKLEIQ